MHKVVLITGVSSGFGKKTAELLADEGYRVYGTSRRKVETRNGISCLYMDVCDWSSVENAISQIIENEGRIDILINNAGMGISGSIEETEIEEAELQMNTNFFGAFYTIKAILPHYRKQGYGTIINISSIGGLMGLPFQAFYSASKFALEGFSEALRMELNPFNIRVVLVNPGDFSTNFTANRKIISKAGASSPYDPQFRKTLAIIERDENNGLAPDFFAKKILKILKKKNPSPKYVVSSLEQKFAILLKLILPDVWFFNILKNHYGMKK